MSARSSSFSLLSDMMSYFRPIFFFLVIAVSHAALSPPEEYWQTVLPNTPIPDGLRDLLRRYAVEAMVTQGPLPIDSYRYTQDGTKDKKAGTQGPLSFDSFPLYTYYGNTQDGTKDKKAGTQGPLSFDSFPLYTYYGNSQDGTKDKEAGTQGPLSFDSFPLYTYYGNTQDDTKDKEAGTQGPLSFDSFPLYTYYGDTQDDTKDKEAGTQGPLSFDSFPLYSYYGNTQDGTKEKKALRGGRIFKNIISFMSTKYRRELAATNAELRSNRLMKSYIFFYEFLQPARNITLLFGEKRKYPILLSREVAKSLPFSIAELPKLLALLSIDPTSNDANNIKQHIHHCEMKTIIPGEVKYCASSLESMIDFVVSTLQTRNINAAMSMLPKEGVTEGQYAITDVNEIDGPNHVTCHLLTYRYALFHCHKLDETKAYKVALVDKNGTKSEMVAICHFNTSKWDRTNMLLQLLKVAPGTVPVCHFLPEGHITWSPNKLSV